MSRPTFSNRAALVMSAAALLMSIGYVGGPALARAMGVNADQVDGLHAVKATASTAQRKGKLVATDPGTGAFRASVIPKGAQFPTVAPVGVSMTGIWGFDSQSAGAGQDYGSLIDFGARLPADVVPILARNGTAVAHCPGRSAAPKAAPGYICLYVTASSGLKLGSVIAYDNKQRGLVYRFTSTAQAANVDLFINGTWALTTAAKSPKGALSGEDPAVTK